MNGKRPSPAMIVAVIALVMSMTGGAIAAVNFAKNAGAVDGRSAVKAKSSKKNAAGKLVATKQGGDSKGKIPFRFLEGVASKGSVAARARGENGVSLLDVPDDGATDRTDLIDLGLGRLQAACFDQAQAAGRENPATRITVTNNSGGAMNLSRRVGVEPPVISTLEDNTVDTFAVGTQNTFSVQLQAGEKTVLVEGTARQAGQGTDNGSCGIFATALLVD